MKNFIFFFLLLNSLTVCSQLVEESRFAIPNAAFTTDPLGNLYVYSRDQLVKYDAKGVFLQRYSDKKLGNITAVDADNPFKILVFYKEQAVVRQLDNMLAPAGGLMRLRDLGFYQPLAVTSSYDNHFWVYDNTNATLVRLSLDFQESIRIENLRLTTNQTIPVKRLDENGNWLYVQDTLGRLFLFDIFGAYHRQLNIEKAASFQPMEESVYLFSDTLVSEFHLKKLSLDPVFPVFRKGDVRIGKSRLYQLSPDSLYIYRW